MADAHRLEQCTGFEWDDGNAIKNWERHGVSAEESEDVFFQGPLVLRSDAKHSKNEKRYYALGQTASGRRLFIAFTIRGDLIRIISARDMNRNEARIYARYEKEDS